MSDKPAYPPAGQYPEPPPPYPASGQDGPYAPGSYPAGGPYSAPSGPYSAPSGQYYPPPQGPPPTTAYYPPSSGTTTTTTVIVAGPGFGFGPHPVNTQCPNCHAQILTETRAQSGTLTWLICLCCVFFGFIFGCCLIPFCVDDLQDVEHRCPQCKQFLGSYRRL